MTVRIYFRGLVLFHFPTSGAEAGRLVAELISEPVAPGSPQRGGPNAHDAEVQIIEGGRKSQLVPRGIARGATVRVTIPGKDGVRRSRSFEQHVPKLSALADRTTPKLSRGSPDDRYVRNTVIVNRGTIRVKDVVIWDAGGFPIGGSVGDAPSSVADVRFMGCGVRGHAANECVVEADDASQVAVSGDDPGVNGEFKSFGRRNQRAPTGAVELLVRNYENQRDRPVPWGLDFQWLFARSGYGTIDLAGPELDTFLAGARRYASALLDEDRAELLPATEGRPFPYIPTDRSPRSPDPLEPGRPAAVTPLTDIDSRPVCVPAEDDS